MAEEGTGANCARDLGRGWKISPSIHIAPGEERTIADIQGTGAIQQMWMTPTGAFRFSIIRIFWDDQETPSVECPLGDFFACGWGKYAQVSSLAVCVNPGSAFNCYWEMPFRKRCRITVTNTAEDRMALYYQINYTLTDVPEDAAYFHAQFRRTNPLPYKEVYTILDGVQGQGHYVGTYMAWGVNNTGWWGEGEIKFFIDGDGEFPTICGTGTEDYFCGSYNFENQRRNSIKSTRHRMPAAASDSARWRLPVADALWSLPLAHHRPDSFRARFARHHSSAGLAQRRTLPAVTGRYRQRGFLVSDVAVRPFPALPDRDLLEVI
jgi:hypothetical protein